MRNVNIFLTEQSTVYKLSVSGEMIWKSQSQNKYKSISSNFWTSPFQFVCFWFFLIQFLQMFVVFLSVCLFVTALLPFWSHLFLVATFFRLFCYSAINWVFYCLFLFVCKKVWLSYLFVCLIGWKVYRKCRQGKWLKESKKNNTK